MDLSTTYMGFELPHPLIPGASPLSARLDSVRQLEDAGAPLIVLDSLFEEQITRESQFLTEAIETPKNSHAEALSYFPQATNSESGPHEYLEHVRRVKQAVSVPVIASLNGTTNGGWIRYARLIQDAGANGLELNLYEVVADSSLDSDRVECRSLDVVRAVRESLSIPLVVKLSPFYTSLSNFARRLDDLKVDGLLLFNRFYQPDIDIESLEAEPVLHLSDRSELLLRLRWIAMLYGHVHASLGITGGVHTAVDAVKAVMVGASSVQMVSALLRRGPSYLNEVRIELARWLEEHEYHSLCQMQGSMSLAHTPNPTAYERANYARILRTWENSE